MTVKVTVTTTPKKQGRTIVENFDTLMSARASIMSVSDKHLSGEALANWRKGH